VLAFVYHIAPEFALPEETPDLFAFRDRVYLVRGVSVTDYRSSMKERSPRWGTVHLPTADFRKLVKPFSAFLQPAGVELEATERGERGSKPADEEDQNQIICLDPR
jgi:hypothetical protein